MVKGAVRVVCAAAAVAAAQAVQWNYVNGGEDWAQTAYPNVTTATCGTGQQQSPINVPLTAVSYPATAAAPLNVTYGTTSSWTMEITQNYIEVLSMITSTSNNTNVAATTTDGIWVDGAFYSLQQFHFHSPSEHTINGVHYPLEMHMVHKNLASSSLAVVGLMFAYSDTDGAFMTKLSTTFSQIGVQAESIPVTAANQMFNLATDVFGATGNSGNVMKTNYMRYPGSLTTPPCTEGVKWHLLVDPFPASRAQVKIFTSMLAIEQADLAPGDTNVYYNNSGPGNGTGIGFSRGADNRLVQPLNGRVITMSLPKPATVASGAVANAASVAAALLAVLSVLMF